MSLRCLAVGILFIHAPGVCHGMPSKAVVNTCLSERQLQKAVKWRELPASNLRLRENFTPGYSAVYFLDNGKSIGVAKKDQQQAIIYNGIMYRLSRAAKIPGFKKSNADIDPFIAGWGVVKDGSDIYLCVNYPSGELGQSGSFQKVRNIALLRLPPPDGRGTLYSAIGEVIDPDD